VDGFVKVSVMTNLKHRVGKRLRKIRRNLDITQEQLAEAVGVTAESISNIERGKTAPSFETMEKIAEVLKVPVRDLFDFPEEK